MRFQLEFRRFLWVFPLALLLQWTLLIFYHRVFLASFYNAMPDLYVPGHQINMLLLLLDASTHVFLFMLIYAQISSSFSSLRGGLLLGLLVALLWYLPPMLQIWAFSASSSLPALILHWSFVGLLSNLVLGAVCGALYYTAAQDD